MKYFSMFTGVGGFELGIKQAYETIKDSGMARERECDSGTPRGQEAVNSSRMGNTQANRDMYDSLCLTSPTCVGFSEIDKYCSKLLQIKWPEIKNYGNATKIDERSLPDFDLLVGGFPCQSFSIAGKRKGFDDTRGTLFFDIARILAHKKPRNVVLENVKGLLSHDGGQTFTTIVRVLTDLGYFVEWQVLNSKNFGVPQNRERVFIVGHLGGQPRQKVFSVDKSKKYPIESRIESKSRILSNAIDRSYYKGPDGKRTVIQRLDASAPHYQDRVYDSKGLSPTLPTGTTGGNLIPKFISKSSIRRLTPLECERLQGFPDNWTKDFSDTQRYKMMGNAVTVNVVEFVIKAIYFSN